MILNSEKQKFLLQLARKTLEYYFQHEETLEINPTETAAELKANTATFVTLTINGELRGCIGKLEATQEMYLDVMENSISAAFNDYRFPALTKEELGKCKIEISLLSPMKLLNYKDPKHLQRILQQTKPGIYLQTDEWHSATFLPQVWQEIPTAVDFLNHLCLKAGLKETAWQTENPNIKTYTVENFSE